jgi:hypothetical protein
MRPIDHHLSPTVAGVRGLVVPQWPDQEKERNGDATRQRNQSGGIDQVWLPGVTTCVASKAAPRTYPESR